MLNFSLRLPGIKIYVFNFINNRNSKKNIAVCLYIYKRKYRK